MVLTVAVLVAIGAMLFTLFIRSQDVPDAPPVSPTAHLEERKAQIYENLRDLQFEFRVGKLSDADYQKTKLDLQRELARAGVEIPIIFITGHGDIPMSVQAMKAGAIEFLTKPFREQDLLDAIQQAIKRDRTARELQRQLADMRGRYESLTPREREVMACVVSGMLNKQTADELGATEKTIKFHRGHIMHKMRAPSLAELVRMGAHLGVPGQRS